MIGPCATPVVFLDVDGVLNNHEFDPDSQSCTIDWGCLQHLNRILRETDARIVLSSAWRYMIHGHAMTLQGFGYMLRTHGMIAAVRGCEDIIIDVTCRDEDVPARADQIIAWLKAHRPPGHVVLDDLDLDWWSELNVVKTDGSVGLTAADAERAIAFLEMGQ